MGVFEVMQKRPSSPGLQRGARGDLWRNTLSQIPSVFGRLVYLSSLCDPNTGVYQHYGLAQIFGEKEADRALRESHEQTFQLWLSFTLERQRADLELYLNGLSGDRRTILETWSRTVPYRNLVPASAGQLGRRLYLADLEAILDLLRSECGAACPDPDA